MNVYSTIDQWRALRRSQPEWQVGFVPTMGGLHEGHGALIRRSVAENPQTVVSVFLNPTQFDQAADLDGYPAERQADLDQLRHWGVDYVLAPDSAAMYPDDFRYRLTESDLSGRFCGAHRPGHFDGVLTVVLKLLNLVQAQRAYFGEKDWQQLRLVQGMAEALFLDVEIIGCPTHRDADGLALSSRNQRLDEPQRRLAPQLYRHLKSHQPAQDVASALRELGFDVDYVEDFAGRRLAAARLGDIRLIDNVPLENVHAS